MGNDDEACPADLPEQPPQYTIVHAMTDGSPDPSTSEQDTPPTH
jgi:hypothetical protein